jgi:predicted nucleic acid-binding Zn ribbon protein
MKKVGDILGAFFDETTLEKAAGYGKLFSTASWEALTKKCALTAASSHSRVASLEHAIVFVEADHPGWVQLLQTKQSELLDGVRELVSGVEIRGISFMLARERNGV